MRCMTAQCYALIAKAHLNCTCNIAELGLLLYQHLAPPTLSALLFSLHVDGSDEDQWQEDEEVAVNTST